MWSAASRRVMSFLPLGNGVRSSNLRCQRLSAVSRRHHLLSAFSAAALTVLAISRSAIATEHASIE